MDKNQAKGINQVCVPSLERLCVSENRCNREKSLKAGVPAA